MRCSAFYGFGCQTDENKCTPKSINTWQRMLLTVGHGNRLSNNWKSKHMEVLHVA